MALGQLPLQAAQTVGELGLRRRALEGAERDRAEELRRFDLSRADARRDAVIAEITNLAATASDAANKMIAGGGDPVEVSRTLRNMYVPVIKRFQAILAPFGQAGEVPLARVETLFDRIASSPSALEIAQAEARTAAGGELAGSEALGLPRSPSQQAFDLNRARIAAAQADASGSAATTSALRTRAQKIDDAMRLQGLSEAEATAQVDNQLRYPVDPVSGRLYAIGPGGEARDITPQRAPVPMRAERGAAMAGQPVAATEAPAEPEEGVTVEEMARATGAVPLAQEAVSRTLGQLSPWFVSQDTAEARTALQGLRNRLVFALSISDRPPVIEQERITQLLPSTGVFESEPRALAVFDQLRRDLIAVRDADARVINAGAVGPQQERALRARVAEVDQLIDRLERAPGQAPAIAPEIEARATAEAEPRAGIGTPSDPAQVNSQAEFDALPRGAFFLDSEGNLARKP